MMKHIIMIGLFFGLILKGYGQRAEKIEFVNYNKVIGDIFATAFSTDLAIKWDYEFVLLLDTMSIDRINEIRPDVVKDFRRGNLYPFLEEYKQLILTDVKSFKDCFTDERLQNLILQNTRIETNINDKKLKSPVYIKDDKYAVYEIYGTDWSECDRLSITDKGLSIETIYIIQE